jgi:hypothetical protein
MYSIYVVFIETNLISNIINLILFKNNFNFRIKKQ